MRICTTRIFAVLTLALAFVPVDLMRAQSPPVMARTYQFPFWSDGDTETQEKAFHIGYRTGFVITNPNSEAINVALVFYNATGGQAIVPLTDGTPVSRVIPARGTLNISTLAAWRSSQRYGRVTASSDSLFFMTEQVELVRIPNPDVRPLIAEDPRVSVMRIEPARAAGEVLISWERSPETDTAFVFANTTNLSLSVIVHAYGASKLTQTIGDMFMAPNGTIIRTIQDFDGSPSHLDPAERRNHGHIRVEAPAGVIMTGVVFRLVGDPILMPAAVATTTP